MQAYILIKCKTGNETKIISEFKEISEVNEINGVWGKTRYNSKGIDL